MSLPPLKRFLGVDDTADARRVLGLPPGGLSRLDITAALHRRLRQVDDHPDGRSVEAHAVRECLRRFARALEAEIGGPRPDEPVRPGSLEATLRPQRPRLAASAGDGRAARQEVPVSRRPSGPHPALTRPVLRLTAFDQQVLAVLVSCGGWNAEARSRLVSIASHHGVTVAGLIKVVGGLSEYARSGGPRLRLDEITSGRPRLVPPTRLRQAESPALVSAITATLAEHLRHDRPAARLKLSLFFGAVTVVAGVLMLYLLIPRTPASEAHDAEGAAVAGAAAPLAAPTETAHAGPQPGPAATVPAPFERVPGFLGNAVPTAAAEAADRGARIPEELDEIARRIGASPSRVAEPVRRHWAEVVRAAATGWVLMDASTRSAIHAAILEVLYVAADSPTDSDHLLGELVPPTPGLVEPVDVWRGAWLAGTLAAVASDASLPPVVVEQARHQMEIALRRSAGPEDLTFATAASSWLERLLPWLVSVSEIDRDAYDLWELWLAAERALGGGERFDGALMAALRELLLRGPDLSRPGPAQDVLGRLVLAGDFTNSPTIRGAVLGMLTDEQIGTGDLWVLTSLLAVHDRTPWFDETLVVPHDADDRMRRRSADRIEDRWSAAARPSEAAVARGSGKIVEGSTLARWRELRERLDREAPAAQPLPLMVQLVLAANVNAAAALLAAQQPDDADAVLEEIERVLAVADRSAQLLAVPPVLAPAPRGQASGPDGQWADGYAKADRNAEERLRLLQTLRQSPGGDLGLLDAAVLVREAYDGGPAEVRSLARDLIVLQFAHGPAVAGELLDQFPSAPRNEPTSEFIMQLTGAVLPPVRSATWPIDARASLVGYALGLRERGADHVDLLEGVLAEAYLAQHRALGGESPPPSEFRAAAPEAAGEVLRRWNRDAALVMAAAPVPDTLAGLDRRHRIRLRLASGSIQNLVAQQLGIVDLLAYVTAAEQPVLGPDLLAALRLSQDRRDNSAHALAQALEAERLAARIWSLRLTGADERREGSS